MAASLTSLDTARAGLLRNVHAVGPVDLPVDRCLGCILADMPHFPGYPERDLAVVDGWAFCSRDLVGASSYSPRQLVRAPVWVDAGNPMPVDCDCVIDPGLVEGVGEHAEVFAEAAPGQGVRRAREDMAERDAGLLSAGVRLREADLLLARVAGLKELNVRRPRLHLVNVPDVTGACPTARFIEETARAAGADVRLTQASARDAASIAGALSAEACDLLVTVGGTGAGTADATVDAFVMSGGILVAHGIGLRPGRTTAVGKLRDIPFIAMPGSPDQALAAWWCLALPVMARLSGKRPERARILPLARKIASSIGLDEVVLVKENDGVWIPLAAGELSLDSIAGADAWLVVPANSEGFGAGAPTGAFPL